MKSKLPNILLLFAALSLFLMFISLTSHNPVFTGGVTGIAKVEIICLTTVSLQVSSVDFGSVPQGYTDNTTDNSPPPMIVQNDGQIMVDVSIARDASSSPLFSGTGGGDNTSSFQFKADYNEAGSFNKSGSAADWKNIPGPAGMMAIASLRYLDNNDSARIDLKINVPSNEPSGFKNETLLFIASASPGAACGDEDVQSADSSCLVFDKIDSLIQIQDDSQTQHDSWDCGKSVGDIMKIRNSCSRSVEITKMRVNWDPDMGELIEHAKFSGSEVWRYHCTWGCSPSGRQHSGALLDFGSRDYALSAYDTVHVTEMHFDSCMPGKTYNIEFTMSDGSTKNSGNFQP